MSSKKLASKTARQAERNRLRNRATKTSVKTLLARAERKIVAKDISASEEVVATISSIDRAVRKGVFHRNRAARLKSRLMRKVSPLASSLTESDQSHIPSPSKGKD